MMLGSKVVNLLASKWRNSRRGVFRKVWGSMDLSSPFRMYSQRRLGRSVKVSAHGEKRC